MPMRLRKPLISVSRNGTKSSPSTRTSPESGLSKPSISFSNTDFPEPETPSRTSVPARGTSNETPCSTRFVSKDNSTWRNSMAGGNLSAASGDIEGVVATLTSHRPTASREPNADQELRNKKIEHDDKHD